MKLFFDLKNKLFLFVYTLLPFYLIALIFGTSVCTAITIQDIYSIPKGVVGSGNGTLDLRLMTYSGSEIRNESDLFNFDNGNNTLPKGGGQDNSSFAESYMTTVGELRDYYLLNFGNDAKEGTEVTLFLDLNETSAAAQQTNHLTKIEIFVVDAADPILRGIDPYGDLLSSEQGVLDQKNNLDMSQLLAALVLSFPSNDYINLPVNGQGAGFADYAILTGIDPFSSGLSSTDVLLFSFSMDRLNNGAEEIFLSGTYSGQDIVSSTVPEPSTFAFLPISLVVSFSRKPLKSSLLLERGERQ